MLGLTYKNKFIIYYKLLNTGKRKGAVIIMADTNKEYFLLRKNVEPLTYDDIDDIESIEAPKPTITEDTTSNDQTK